MKYINGLYNKVKDAIQYIRIGDGCPNQCDFCYAPKKHVFYGIPKIRAKYVKILDMNFLSYPNVKSIMVDLKDQQFKGKKVHYELVCGIDYRFLTDCISNILKECRFIKPRFAWDGGLEIQYEIRKTWRKLEKVGYNNIGCFILANWKVPYKDCLFKLDLLKVWRVKALDCYFDGQVSPHVQPIYWSKNKISTFRKKCRKHNQIVRFKFDPEMRQKTCLTRSKKVVSIASLR